MSCIWMASQYYKLSTQRLLFKLPDFLKICQLRTLRRSYDFARSIYIKDHLIISLTIQERISHLPNLNNI
jgi:hypothetical protein